MPNPSESEIFRTGKTTASLLGAWTTATVQFEKSGKFAIDYGHEDILNIWLYGIQRIEVWEYETFGILPENEKNKEIVLNYIKNKEENNN